MQSLDKLREIRLEVRSFYLRKYHKDTEPFLWGVNFKVNEENYKKFHEEVVEYFVSRNYDISHPNAPSPSGENPEGYKVYISSVVDNDDYSKHVGIAVSIHHEDESLIPREDRVNYCY